MPGMAIRSATRKSSGFRSLAKSASCSIAKSCQLNGCGFVSSCGSYRLTLAAIALISSSGSGVSHLTLSRAASIASWFAPCRRMAPAILVKVWLRCPFGISASPVTLVTGLLPLRADLMRCGSLSNGVRFSPGIGNSLMRYFAPTITTKPPTPRISMPGSNPATVLRGCPVVST